MLKDPTPTQLVSIVNTASGLLGSDAVSSLIKQLPTLLSSVSGILTPALITNVTDIIGNAHDLLTAKFVSETSGLINDVAPVSFPYETLCLKVTDVKLAGFCYCTSYFGAAECGVWY